MAEIASAHVTIYPKFASGFSDGVKSEVGKAGDAGGKAFNKGFTGVVGGKGRGGATAVLGGLKAGLVGLAAKVTVGALADGFRSVTTAASDLNETVNKSKAIFGEQYAAVDSWANGAARAMGLSKSAALDAASGFGDMFTQIGFGGDQAAKMSTSVVQMSADLGSFNNLPTADVADRISAAFRGEYDSLQMVIPNINAARVESEAMAMTGKKTAKSLTAQEKAAAVLAIVQKDGARAMGDFARTSGEAANKAKIMKGRGDELKASFGGLMGPLQKVANEGLEGLLTAGEQVTAWLARNPEVIEGFAAGLSLAGDALKGLAALAVPALSVLSEGFSQIVGAMAGMLEALGTVPGFEWAKDAAVKLNKMKDGAHAAALGLEDAAMAMWGAEKSSRKANGEIDGLNGVLAEVPALTEAKVLAPGAKPSKSDVDRLIDSVGNVPGLTKAEIRTLANLYGVNAAKAAINTVKSKDVWITVHTKTTGDNLNGSYRTIRRADGGPVPGFAAGGRVGGFSPHPRADNIQANLTAGEYVQPVPSVKHYGIEAMEAVRRRRAVISYSEGGSVGTSSTSAGTSAADLLRALASVELRITGFDPVMDRAYGRLMLAADRGI